MPRMIATLARLWSRADLAKSAEEKASRTARLIAMETMGQPVWSSRDFAAFAREGFMQNAIVYRAVRMIVEAAASVPLVLYDGPQDLVHRGEIDARLNGRTFTLCLTLGALAELEAAFGGEDLVALASRFEGGRISAGDCRRIIGAGLRGAGHAISDDEVSTMQTEGGAAGFIDIVARLLTVTFTRPGPSEAGEDVGERGTPFPGAR